MLRRPRLLDLYCCAGGAAMGYHRAGFDVVGVDINPQPRYPFEFRRGDVLAMSPEEIAAEFDAIHASPPCQFATEIRPSNKHRKTHENLIPATRALCRATGLPYIIENVEGAREHLIDPIRLCGSSFDLGTGDAELRRHRLFEVSFPVLFVPQCSHRKARVIGVYGGHGRDRRRKINTQDFSVDQRAEAMGIDWIRGNALSQAIPPAYTEWLGERLMREISAARSLSEIAA